MAYVTPHVWGSGDILLAADLNDLGSDIAFIHSTNGTSFPGSPEDQQEYVYDVDPTNGSIWKFRYNLAATAWLFVGGVSLQNVVDVDEDTTSTSYDVLTTPGPSVVIPFAGVFDIETGMKTYSSGAGTTIAYMSFDIGGSSAVDTNALTLEQDAAGAGSFGTFVSRVQRLTLTAVTLTAKYKVSGATGMRWDHRYIKVTPVTV